MNTKEAIDYRRYYIDYLSNLIEENLKKLREINDMPENLVEEKIIEDRMDNIRKAERGTSK